MISLVKHANLLLLEREADHYYNKKSASLPITELGSVTKPKINKKN